MSRSGSGRPSRRRWESFAAVFSVLGLEDLGKRFEFGLEGVVGLLLGHDDPS